MSATDQVSVSKVKEKRETFPYWAAWSDTREPAPDPSWEGLLLPLLPRSHVSWFWKRKRNSIKGFQTWVIFGITKKRWVFFLPLFFVFAGFCMPSQLTYSFRLWGYYDPGPRNLHFCFLQKEPREFQVCDQIWNPGLSGWVHHKGAIALIIPVTLKLFLNTGVFFIPRVVNGG